MLWTRSQILMRITRTSWAMAMSILRRFSIGDPLHQVGHGLAEPLGHLLVGGVSVLNGVVEKGGHDGVRVQSQFRHQVGHLQGVGDIGGAVLPQLPLMVAAGVVKGVPDPGPVLLCEILQFLFQLLKTSLQLVFHRPSLSSRRAPARRTGSGTCAAPLMSSNDFFSLLPRQWAGAFE